MQYRYWYVYDCMFSEFGMMPDARTVCAVTFLSHSAVRFHITNGGKEQARA